MRATRVINLYTGIYNGFKRFLFTSYLHVVKSKMAIRSYFLYLIYTRMRKQGICKDKCNDCYRYMSLVAATLPRSHAVPSCDFSFAVWRVPLSILYIIIYIIIYNIKYILIIYNFQEAVFITFWKSKWDSVAAWLRWCYGAQSSSYSLGKSVLRNFWRPSWI